MSIVQMSSCIKTFEELIYKSILQFQGQILMIKMIAIFAFICLSLQVLVPATRSSLQTLILPQIPYTVSYPVTLDNGGMDNFALHALYFIAIISPDITYQVTFGYQYFSLGATLHIATLGNFTARANNGVRITFVRTVYSDKQAYYESRGNEIDYK